MNVSAIVLAGGKGSRMGGVDKGLQPLRGKPMIEWVLGRLAPQVAEVIVNANQNIARYEKYAADNGLTFTTVGSADKAYENVVLDLVWKSRSPARAG